MLGVKISLLMLLEFYLQTLNEKNADLLSGCIIILEQKMPPCVSFRKWNKQSFRRKNRLIKLLGETNQIMSPKELKLDLYPKRDGSFGKNAWGLFNGVHYTSNVINDGNNTLVTFLV